MPPPPLGCDLSHHNPRVRIGTLKQSELEFVGLKPTKGAVCTDPKFADRRLRAQFEGFRRILPSYFVRPLDDAWAKAYPFAQVVEALASDRRLVLDIERTGWGRRKRLASLWPRTDGGPVRGFGGRVDLDGWLDQEAWS